MTTTTIERPADVEDFCNQELLPEEAVELRRLWDDLQEDLRNIFQSLKKTVVLVTHDMGEAGFHCLGIAGRIEHNIEAFVVC